MCQFGLVALLKVCGFFLPLTDIGVALSNALTGTLASSMVTLQSETSSGVLIPGGTFTSPDGVMVSAPGNSLLAPVQVFIEPVEERDLPAPLPVGMIAVSRYFRLRSMIDVGSGRDMFAIDIPVPEAVSPVGLSVAVFIPAGYGGPHLRVAYWDAVERNRDPSATTIRIDLASLIEEGFVVVVVKDRYASSVMSTRTASTCEAVFSSITPLFPA